MGSQGNLEGRFFPEDPEGYVEKVLGKGISLHRGTAGECGRGPFTRDFKRWMKGTPGVGRL